MIFRLFSRIANNAVQFSPVPVHINNNIRHLIILPSNDDYIMMMMMMMIIAYHLVNSKSNNSSPYTTSKRMNSSLIWSSFRVKTLLLFVIYNNKSRGLTFALRHSLGCDLQFILSLHLTIYIRDT